MSATRSPATRSPATTECADMDKAKVARVARNWKMKKADLPQQLAKAVGMGMESWPKVRQYAIMAAGWCIDAGYPLANSGDIKLNIDRVAEAMLAAARDEIAAQIIDVMDGIHHRLAADGIDVAKLVG